MPKPNFIFDNYKVQNDLFKQEESAADPFIQQLQGKDSEAPQSQQREPTGEKVVDNVDADDDFFSFFSSHEKIIMKPESSFKNLRSFLVSLPIDYYILLQGQYQLS